MIDPDPGIEGVEDITQGVRPRPETEVELRLALAMRGGVSLAVWIGGACAEIDAVRRSIKLSPERDGGSLYASLLRAAGFSGVTIDVISGASAGGLNGAILSTTLAYGVRFDQMRDMWLHLADISRLMRSPNERSPLSVLKGDDYFLSQLDLQLRRLIEERGEDPLDKRLERLDLFLAATLMYPIPVVISADPFQRITETRHRALFHFKHHARAGACLTDYDVEPATIAHRLAVAGRATSSFPGAFEPARITTRRPPHLGARPTDPEDLFGIFSETDDQGFDVIDGGVLDNIPVAQAIRAIAAAPADDPVERYLLFLHPSPVLTESVLPSPRPGALRTAVRTLSIKSNQESLLSDIEVLNEHNQKAYDYRDLRPELLPIDRGLSGNDPVPEVILKATKRCRGYPELRGSQAGRVIRELLEDPVAYIERDPFSKPIGPILVDWTGPARAALEQAIAWARRENLVPAFPDHGRSLPSTLEGLSALDLGALWRTTDLLIDWAIDVQGRLSTEDGIEGRRLDAVATLKRGLYEVRTIADELISYDDYLWALYARKQPPPRSGRERQRVWAKGAFDLATASLFRHPLEGAATEILAHLSDYLTLAGGVMSLATREELRNERDRLAKELPLALCRLEGEIAAAMKDPHPLPDPTVDLRQGLWTYVLSMAALLAQVARTNPRPRTSEDAVFEVLDSAPSDSISGMTQLLASLEVLLFAVSIALETSQPIALRQITGTNRTPLEGFFPGGTLTVKDKLAGNELANFAAFYKASWRANDWMWGRMDAVVSMIDLLAQPERIRRHYSAPPGTAPAASLEAVVEQLFTAPVLLEPQATREELEAWHRHFQDRWDSRRPVIHKELVELFGPGDDPRSIDGVKALLVERRHWEILLSELPTVVQAANEEELGETGVLGASQSIGGPRGRIAGLWRRLRLVWARLRTRARRIRPGPLAQAVAAISGAGHNPLREPEGVRRLLLRYQVGQETVQGDVATKRFARLSADLALVAWNALAGPSPPGPLRPVGWTIRIGRHVARTVVGAPRVALLALPVLLLVTSYLAVSGRKALGLEPVALGMIAVGIAAVLILWMTSLSRIVLFLAVFLSLVYAVGHLSGSIELSFDKRVLIESTDPATRVAVQWILGVAAFLTGVLLFRLVPYIQRRWVGWVSVGFAAAVVAVARFTRPGRDLFSGRTWLLMIAVIVSLTVLPVAESLFDRRRRQRADKERRQRAASSPLDNPSFE